MRYRYSVIANILFKFFLLEHINKNMDSLLEMWNTMKFHRPCPYSTYGIIKEAGHIFQSRLQHYLIFVSDKDCILQIGFQWINDSFYYNLQMEV